MHAPRCRARGFRTTLLAEAARHSPHSPHCNFARFSRQPGQEMQGTSRDEWHIAARGVTGVTIRRYHSDHYKHSYHNSTAYIHCIALHKLQIRIYTTTYTTYHYKRYNTITHC